MDPSCFHAKSVGPLLVFVRQYFSMLPNITQNATEGRNRIKITKTAMKSVFHGRKLVAGAGFEPTTFRLWAWKVSPLCIFLTVIALGTAWKLAGKSGVVTLQRIEAGSCRWPFFIAFHHPGFWFICGCMAEKISNIFFPTRSYRQSPGWFPATNRPMSCLTI